MFVSLFQKVCARYGRQRTGRAPFTLAVRLPGGWFAQTRCARHIDATSRRIAFLGGKIERLSQRLQAGSLPAVVDADGSLRRMLDELKQELLGMRRALARWHHRECAGRAGRRLEAAIAGLNRIVADTEAAADRLRGELDDYAGRQFGLP